MPRDPDDDLNAQNEGPDSIDLRDEDSSDTDPCPHCGRPVYEGAEQCPRCGKYLSLEDSSRRWPWWIWAGAILALLGCLKWIF